MPDSTARIGPIARQRRHNLSFLSAIRAFAPVSLDTEVDMTAVLRHRAGAATGDRASLVTYVLYAGARVMAAHPEANAAITGRFRPRVGHYSTVDGKVALDKRMGGHRIVLSTVVPDADRASLLDIQRHVERRRDGDADTLPEYAGVRLLHKLPVPVGQVLFRIGIRSLRTRPKRLGTFSVTSLGHRPVDGFYSVGGTTVTLGVGQVADRPVAREGAVRIAPVMRLSLTFDHRVIDGAEAADVLAEVKDGLERFAPEPATPHLERLAR